MFKKLQQISKLKIIHSYQLSIVLIFGVVFTGYSDEEFTCLQFSKLNVIPIPAENVIATIEPKGSVEELNIKISAMNGFPQVKIFIPYKYDFKSYSKIILRVKLVTPDLPGKIPLVVDFYSKEGRLKTDNRYINAKLHKNEYIDLDFNFSKDIIKDLSYICIAVKSPKVNCEFVIGGIFLAYQDAYIPSLPSKQQQETAITIISKDDVKKRIINGREFKLIWEDEFNENLDKWEPRWDMRNGYYSNAYKSFCTADGHYLDGNGHLVIAYAAYPKSKAMDIIKNDKKQLESISNNTNEYIRATTVGITTKEEFLYGYHEIRFKMPALVPAPMFCAWFHGNGDGLVEIDISENSLYSLKTNGFVDYKSSTLHWYQPGKYPDKNYHCYIAYQLQHLSGDIEESKLLANTGKNKETELEIVTLHQNNTVKLTEPLKAFNVIDRSINGLIRKAILVNDTRYYWDDNDWHTVALLWEKNAYSFYYDGIFVCRFDEKDGVPGRGKPGGMIISTRGSYTGKHVPGITDCLKKTPAKILVDYYRVYASNECGKVIY